MLQNKLLDNKINFVIIFAALLLLTPQVFSQDIADAADSETEMEAQEESEEDTDVENEAATPPSPRPPAITPRETIFLGITDRAGQSIQSDFENAIRAELAASPMIALVNELETRRVVREIERLNRTRAEHFIPPTFTLSDTAIVIRITAEEPAISLGRSWLIFGRIDAAVNVRVYFREFNGDASYTGEFYATSSKRKQWLFFANPKKAIHVSAPERLELVGNAQRDVIRQIDEFVRLFYNSLR